MSDKPQIALESIILHLYFYNIQQHGLNYITYYFKMGGRRTANVTKDNT